MQIQASFSLDDQNRVRVITEMFERGWFGQGAAFWRWIDTAGAQPFIGVCAEMFGMPGDRRPSGIGAEHDEAVRIIGDPGRLNALAGWTVTSFVEPGANTPEPPE